MRLRSLPVRELVPGAKRTGGTPGASWTWTGTWGKRVYFVAGETYEVRDEGVRIMRIKPLMVALILASPAQSLAGNPGDLSCRDIVGDGWDRMPTTEITEYVLKKKGSLRLGLGSECHISSLVFMQCWMSTKDSVQEAVDDLIHKADHNKKLPDYFVCGA